MGTIKRTYKLDEAVLADAVALAEKKGTSVTAIIENAIRCYKDYTYMETAAFVPDQFVRQVNASLRLLEKGKMQRRTKFCQSWPSRNAS